MSESTVIRPIRWLQAFATPVGQRAKTRSASSRISLVSGLASGASRCRSISSRALETRCACKGCAYSSSPASTIHIRIAPPGKAMKPTPSRAPRRQVLAQTRDESVQTRAPLFRDIVPQDRGKQAYLFFFEEFQQSARGKHIPFEKAPALEQDKILLEQLTGLANAALPAKLRAPAIRSSWQGEIDAISGFRWRMHPAQARGLRLEDGITAQIETQIAAPSPNTLRRTRISRESPSRKRFIQGRDGESRSGACRIATSSSGGLEAHGGMALIGFHESHFAQQGPLFSSSARARRSGVSASSASTISPWAARRASHICIEADCRRCNPR